MTELVAVIKDESRFRMPFLGRVFVPASETSFDNDALSAMAELKEKTLAEGNIFFVQLVTYVVILNPLKQKIFLGKRIGGESRLLNASSIGFGGHVSDKDYSLPVRDEDFVNALDRCAERELREELRIQNKKLDLHHIGYARDLESDTSEHIGAVYYLVTGSASVNEKDNIKGRWLSYAEFKDSHYQGLESWGKAVFDYLYEDEDIASLLKLA